ncbi:MULTISPECIES: SIS domain-containing protein [unclassified Sphingopyxis]|jgi:glucosamine--fructose-6-phosphate aminotransferase (isomerizing)|uniref:SIS domain-containing protein n=1 Tax=unclassified Sphingopyxis TaxID=2614943 RepID=UPI0006BF6F50|nr:MULTISPECIES: SIS domain-containing protein [unclassified Sphingopyxis]USI75623.1 SIS domain-containing protein [Sphingopyxis sp. USTB-05]GAO77863.1 glucosamine-6-phosphate deaminase [isomerizing], alternative [Sphingopyxis sp. C-1]
MTPNAASDGRQTLMEQEAGEAADAVANMLEANRDAFGAIGRRLRASPPAAVVTCARGSSDHAATYAKYLIETMTGTPTASAALSIASLYDAPAVAGNRLCLAISQSGKSPDLLAAVEQQRDAGAFVVALVNAEDSPLAALADVVIPLSAGVERSVAATKSYIASLAAIAALVAAWTEDAALENALTALPGQLAEAFALDWSPAIGAFKGATNLFVLGRGYGLGAAQEAALKFKETSGLHAESFSAAEVRHGPMAIVGDSFHVLALGGTDRAAAGVRSVADEFRGRGATVLLADPAGGDLPAIAAHPAIEPILLIQSFYRMASALALTRGRNPDSPPHLNKVTETL